MDKSGFTPTSDPHSPSGVYIPVSLQGCFEELDRMLSVSLLEKIRNCEEADLIQQHFGLGMWIRNNWDLWASWSRMKEYFDSLGV